MNWILNTKLISLVFLAAAGLSISSCQTADTLSSAANENKGRAKINGPLKPFKDDRFSYRPALEIRDNGNFIKVPYDEARDINARDEIPVRKVRGGYIKRLASGSVRDFTYTAQGRTNAIYGAGNLDAGGGINVIYLHGKDGNRKWGFDDERFGGNFNRIKNLMVENGGIYLSPDFTNFEDAGYSDIASLIEQRSAKGAGKIIIACGSMGTKLCWALADNAETRKNISGLIVLGGFPDRDFLRVAYSGALNPVPVYIAHGSRDPVYDVAAMEDFYNALNIKSYPVQMTIFETGNHGTPVRMIDWRQAINWIASH